MATMATVRTRTPIRDMIIVIMIITGMPMVRNRRNFVAGTG
jgi:hypothetical protein